jgi:hypothetical protein
MNWPLFNWLVLGLPAGLFLLALAIFAFVKMNRIFKFFSESDPTVDDTVVDDDMLVRLEESSSNSTESQEEAVV